MNHEELVNALLMVLLFHRGGPWTAADSDAWVALGGGADVTTRALCDRIRAVLALPPTPEERDVLATITAAANDLEFIAKTQIDGTRCTDDPAAGIMVNVRNLRALIEKVSS
jgi:hypothetical protein